MIVNAVKKVVIVGGGTAGWITAALLVRMLGKNLELSLIESEQIGTVGVGEATIPPIMALNNALGLDEAEFLKATNGSIKLGIQFENWHQQGDSYMHAFGELGKDFPFCSFHHYWTRAVKEGIVSNEEQGASFWDYSLSYQAAKQNKFTRMDKIEGTNLKGLVYAYHFDASLYAQFLRLYSEEKGVKRIEGLVEKCNLINGAGFGNNGFVESLTLENGDVIEGDLFIDCSGFRGLLIEQALNTGYENWTHWLPCDRAVAVQCESVDTITPYTRSIAHDAGWQWRIPLQYRTGNGLVYCSKYQSDDEAKALLLSQLDGEALGEPRVIPFTTGRRLKNWNRNCIAIGLSSGFLEPLESTSIHLIQSSVIRLIKHFPHAGIKPAEVDEYNRQSKMEIEHVRDFIIMHYYLNKRDDSPFWRACQRMDIPESLSKKIDLFKTTGKIFPEPDGLFTEVAWQQVMIGQGIIPEDYHPLANALTSDQLKEFMANLKLLINGTVKKLPTHNDFLKAVQ